MVQLQNLRSACWEYRSSINSLKRQLKDKRLVNYLCYYIFMRLCFSCPTGYGICYTNKLVRCTFKCIISVLYISIVPSELVFTAINPRAFLNEAEKIRFLTGDNRDKELGSLANYFMETVSVFGGSTMRKRMIILNHFLGESYINWGYQVRCAHNSNRDVFNFLITDPTFGQYSTSHCSMCYNDEYDQREIIPISLFLIMFVSIWVYYS
uniref:Peptidase_M13 domain-containing protein n=1 Tax=Heterorhabditis bacteriophora TaxID=37862 RepID=A0A1I7WLX7_HETBA